MGHPIRRNLPEIFRSDTIRHSAIHPFYGTKAINAYLMLVAAKLVGFVMWIFRLIVMPDVVIWTPATVIDPFSVIVVVRIVHRLVVRELAINGPDLAACDFIRKGVARAVAVGVEEYAWCQRW